MCFSSAAVRNTNLKDEQNEEEQQEDLDADDQQLREEMSQHRLHGAHTCNTPDNTHHHQYSITNTTLIKIYQ